MKTIELKQEIHSLVDEINDDELLKAVQVLLKPHRNEFDFSESDIQEFDKRMQDRENGIGKSYSLDEAESYFKNKKQ